MESRVHVNNFIDGKFVSTEKYLESRNPANEEINGFIPDSNENDADQAIKAAEKAFPTWSHLTNGERAQYLNRIADLVQSRLDEFARAESSDQGKPYWLARSIEIPRVVDNFRFFASALLQCRESATQHGTIPTVFSYTVRHPCGVAVLISPWNLPLYLLTWKIAPCIAFGCTCVCKPSEFTSITAFLFAQVLIDAELPPGVVNIVFGLGSRIGQSLVSHPAVKVISFTGSTTTGYHIKKSTAHSSVKLSLEMGGKNSAIIFEDVDFEKCIPVLLRSTFQNSGQICLCTSRIYIQRSIFDKFLEKFLAEVKKLQVGDPFDENTRMGPVVSKEHYEKVCRYINFAKENSFQVIESGVLDEKLSNKGYFIRPTIILNVDDQSKLMTEEIFGPVICVVPFDNEDEVVRRANNNQYGLCGCIWTENVSRAHRVANHLECGTVWINCWMLRDLRMPFGGIKDSGMGREGFPYSEEVFTESKTICLNLV